MNYILKLLIYLYAGQVAGAFVGYLQFGNRKLLLKMLIPLWPFVEMAKELLTTKKKKR